MQSTETVLISGFVDSASARCVPVQPVCRRGL